MAHQSRQLISLERYTDAPQFLHLALNSSLQISTSFPQEGQGKSSGFGWRMNLAPGHLLSLIKTPFIAGKE
jgi:hypothetical protein